MRWIHARDELTQKSDASIKEYMKNVKLGVRKDALSSLIEGQDEDGTGLSHEDLVAAGLVLIVGGTDS